MAQILLHWIVCQFSTSKLLHVHGSEATSRTALTTIPLKSQPQIISSTLPNLKIIKISILNGGHLAVFYHYFYKLLQLFLHLLIYNIDFAFKSLKIQARRKGYHGNINDFFKIKTKSPSKQEYMDTDHYAWQPICLLNEQFVTLNPH